MGISGLLPLLKDIQVNKHLSEYAGQTIAVDAYVWLHRGTYACATEIATGRKTTKYVDYAMHRVRILRHFKIEPYLVFDGGPLPAKKGTEVDRKKRRDENLARAKALAGQGKHSQAREYYVKCVDVTPQMAYQLIKALRAENVAYVVAPYEADAQMAYMERLSLVSGILTEDSDLLVFGCKHVLFKLDTTENTVIAISRTDFASLISSTSGISLLGWSDVQFRAMAILSGCDYLPSIPGIGLKTAWTLLRKHKTAENVIRAVMMEGKKAVPQGYLKSFRLAETVFLHQRVYDPVFERLVHLMDVSDEEQWDEEKEAYVGMYLEPSLAKQIAKGDICPITLLPMEDINPTFVPRALRPLRMNTSAVHTPEVKGKGKGKMIAASEKSKGTSLLTFFTPKAKLESAPRGLPQPVRAQTDPRKTGTVAGRSSGKRTLAELMDEDVLAKRKKRNEEDELRRSPSHTSIATSRFFRVPPTTAEKVTDVSNDVSDTESVAGPSTLALMKQGKENVPCLDDDCGEISEEDPDPVTQEEGYMSPSPSYSKWDSPEMSSPTRPRIYGAGNSLSDDDDFDADILSSPPSAARRPKSQGTPSRSPGRILVHGTPTCPKRIRDVAPENAPGPDLRAMFEDWEEGTSDIDEGGEDSMGSMASSSGPVTPVCAGQPAGRCVDDIFDEVTPDDEEIETQAVTARNERVANGWWEKWACSSRTPSARPSKVGSLRRRETTITADGRHRSIAIQQSRTRDLPQGRDLRSAARKSLSHLHEVEASSKNAHKGEIKARTGSSTSVSERPQEILTSAKARLAAFRYVV
ncbi:hypothetical protein NM688_g5730 [Phlebia brevispora]|uniref:Uncharacterized protein n=1 Tax=Phlebia brevispora TaxID=194682 RepID=A0ACC1SR76_9APHY|nr:hypothetical protein NM688_g5730 [Phlebia brevispora]